MKVVTRIPLVNTISFWLIVGLFIYFTGNLFFLLFIPSVIETHDKEFIKNILMIYSGVTITKNLILSAAWFAKEQVQTDDDIIKIPEYIDLDDNFTFIKNTNP